jgi:hypothetical protein
MERAMGEQMPDQWEKKLRLELWRLGEESKRLFDELPDADLRRLSEILDELQIAQSRINDKIMALRAVLSVK